MVSQHPKKILPIKGNITAQIQQKHELSEKKEIPLRSPRMRRPMKKGKKRMKFHKEAHNPVGGSISLSHSIGSSTQNQAKLVYKSHR